MTIAILFVRPDTIYRTITGCEIYDESRDARTWPGGTQLVAHPPCRAWGRLRHFANPLPHEMDIARWAVTQVRIYGGVLEHPAGSLLWADQKMATTATPDIHRGWTLPIQQLSFGHKARKNTWLYICGCEPRNIPSMPLALDYPTHVIETRRRPGALPSVTKAERERTPPLLAAWLVDLATRCAPAPAK